LNLNAPAWSGCPAGNGQYNVMFFCHPGDSPMVVRMLLAAASLAIIATASAQQVSPAPARAPVAPHGCKKPGEHPGRLATDNQRRSWVREVNDYLACLKKFAMDQQAIAQPLFDQAKPHADAANAAIDEHNKAVNQFKDEQEKNN